MLSETEFSDDYNKTVAEYYDSTYKQVLAEGRDIEFYAELAAENAGPVLELGCGTGRVLLELTRRGIDCTGLDSSEAMLARLIDNAHPEEPKVVRAQMQNFDLRPRSFRLIFAAFRPFQHLYSVKDQLGCLRSVLDHLEPGGCFAFDVFNPRLEHVLQPSEPERADLRFEHGGAEVVRYVTELRYPAEQLTEITMRFETQRDGEVIQDESELIRMRWFTRFELEHLMARAGFERVVIYGDFDRSEVHMGSPQLVVVGTAPV